MPKSIQLKGSDVLFDTKDKLTEFVPTQSQYRRTAEFMKELAKQDIENMKLEKAVQDYYRETTQLTEAIDTLRDSDDIPTESKFKQITELQKALNSKVNPAYDGEFLIRQVDQNIEALNLAVEYLHDVLDPNLTKKQITIIDDANGTDIIKFGHTVANAIMGIKEDTPDKQDDGKEKSDEKNDVDAGLDD